jgi:hypothetical protein
MSDIHPHVAASGIGLNDRDSKGHDDGPALQEFQHQVAQFIAPDALKLCALVRNGIMDAMTSPGRC